MIYYKTTAEVELMRESALLVSKTLATVARALKPGISTLEIDALAEKFITENNAKPSFKNYKGFPFTCCISVNDAVVHGFPNDVALKEGDIVSVDVGVYKNGFHGDSAYTFALGAINEDVQRLMRVTKQSLYLGIEKAVAGNRVGDISFAIQEFAERKHKYGVVRELVGHGLGKSLHEDPQVPNYGKRGSGAKLHDGLVIAIEPMINMGVKEVWYEEDGWTVKTKDGKPAAHYEHTVCIRRGKADILSSFEEIELEEKNNPHLFYAY
ncbi:type I methionyl aminopeptidase [Flavihumibacter sp. ZG627]|uniref:type I methionyl aminopeptidase n=1 Tax=Flavihumibacter sp. ZG627 TaxID=1463156 RepID=UPI00057E3E28|nr:type I methionyl aminopeptidase [Flavihumibacter sp. ZG627]KIC90237.1 methionine aminopeptidase [Flavihumibacter sp. ZG627]